MPTDMTIPREKWVELARKKYEKEGEIEIDDNAKISHNDSGDDGCYVQAWVWVENPEPEQDED